MVDEFVVFCVAVASNRHPIGTLAACEQCQIYWQKRKELMAKKQEPITYAPLVDISTPGLYRDECFWQFHYHDVGSRLQAMREYEEHHASFTPADETEEWLDDPDLIAWMKA